MPQLNKQLISQRQGKAVIEHLHAKTQEEEARMVVEKILELKQRYCSENDGIPSPPTSGFRTTTGSYQSSLPRTFRKVQGRDSLQDDVTWNDFAILVRANSQAEIFCQALDQVEIPYQSLASSGLYSKPIILDILAYLKLLDNYHESSALYRILNLLVFKINSRDVINLNYWAKRKNWSLYETLKKAASLNISQQGIGEINKVLALIERHTQLAREKSVSKVVFAFLEDSGYLKLLTNLYESTTNNTNSICEISGKFVNIRENLNYVNQFFRKIEEFERVNLDKSIKAFQEEIELARDAGDTGALEKDIEEGPEAVKIMTIHGAKGLEFRYVFISNLVDRRFPTIERKDPIELPDALVKEIVPEGDIHLQEERRLFYVAMTRAKEGLFFTSADNYGGQRKKRLSRFLEEIRVPISNFQFLISNKITNHKSQIQNKFQIQNSKFKTSNKYSRKTCPELVEGFVGNSYKFTIPKRFSFTQLKAFETCPLQYKFAHILRVPVKGQFTFSFGKSMHTTLHRFFKRWMEGRGKGQGNLFGNQMSDVRYQKSEISLDELLQIYKSAWIDDWYESKAHQEEYKEKGRKILKEFYEIIKKDPPSPKYLELKFNFRLEDYSIKGEIDRVDVIKSKVKKPVLSLSKDQKSKVKNKDSEIWNNDTAVEIIDYKTGKVKDEKSLSLDDKKQLLIYQLAAQNVLREKVAKLSFYYLNENKKVSFLGTDEELEVMKKKIIQIIGEIKKSNFPAQPNAFKCNFCDFKEICEHRAV